MISGGSLRRNVLPMGLSAALVVRVPFRCVQNTLKSKFGVVKDEDSATTKISREDLTSALQHREKLRVSHKEIETMDEEVEYWRTRKVSRRYAHDINKNVFSPQVQKAIEAKKGARTDPLKRKVVFTQRRFGGGVQETGKIVGFDKNSALHSKTNQTLFQNFNKREEFKHPKCPDPAKGTLKESVAATGRVIKKEPDTLIHTETLTGDKRLDQLAPLDPSKIASLAHKLDRTLFSPGVHFLQDPRTRIYNFTPYLKHIIKLDDFNFDAIETFVSVSKDQTLLDMARKLSKQFYSSTSSMTSSLVQFYLFLNNYLPQYSDRFPFPSLGGFIKHAASSIIVQPKGMNEVTGDTVYSIESDKSADTEILLSAMGHCLETLLTTDEEKFKQYLQNFEEPVKQENGGSKPESQENKPQNTYNYSSYGNFLMRSQLDCYDERLPGNGTFDLKTRAVCSVRYDSKNPNLEDNKYQIWKLRGKYESFEREIDDLIKTGALLKYGFQARIGQMDGIFIAYHNLNSFFGFQYLPLSEIDNIFYSHKLLETKRHIGAQKIEDIEDDLPTHVAETQFKLSLDIWDRLMNQIIHDIGQESKYKNSAFRVVMKAKKRPGSFKHRLYVSAVPLNKDQIQKLQHFPTQFKTGFKEDVSYTERARNLKLHQQELDEFNKSTISSDLGVLSYYVDTEHYFGNYGRPIKDLHPYPRSKSQPWSCKIEIYRQRPMPEKYLLMLSAATKMLTSGLSDPESGQNQRSFSGEATGTSIVGRKKRTSRPKSVYQTYSTIGEARAKEWEEKDSNPVMNDISPEC